MCDKVLVVGAHSQIQACLVAPVVKLSYQDHSCTFLVFIVALVEDTGGHFLIGSVVMANIKRHRAIKIGTVDYY